MGVLRMMEVLWVVGWTRNGVGKIEKEEGEEQEIRRRRKHE